MNTPYSQAYLPSAAVLEIQFAPPGRALISEPITVLIDTGADASVMPKSLLLAIGAPSLYEAQLRSPWGEPHVVVVYLVDVLIGIQRLPGIEIAADETDSESLLGRNILNKLPLFLDGPGQVTQLLTGPALQRLRSSRSSPTPS